MILLAGALTPECLQRGFHMCACDIHECIMNQALNVCEEVEEEEEEEEEAAADFEISCAGICFFFW